MNRADKLALSKGTKPNLWINRQLWITQSASDSHAGASDCMQGLGDRVGECVDFGGIET
jgi:hypothetical protein